MSSNGKGLGLLLREKRTVIFADQIAQFLLGQGEKALPLAHDGQGDHQIPGVQIERHEIVVAAKIGKAAFHQETETESLCGQFNGGCVVGGVEPMGEVDVIARQKVIHMAAYGQIAVKGDEMGVGKKMEIAADFRLWQTEQGFRRRKTALEDEENALVSDDLNGDVRAQGIDGGVHHGKVNGFAAQQGSEFADGVLVEIDAYVGMLVTKGGENGGGQQGTTPCTDADVQFMVAVTGEHVEIGAHFLVKIVAALEIVSIDFSRFRQLKGRFPAVKKLYTELLFQTTDVLGEIRLGDEEFFRCAGNAALGCHREEIFRGFIDFQQYVHRLYKGIIAGNIGKVKVEYNKNAIFPVELS